LDADQEHFVLLALDTKKRITGYKVISTGTLNSSLVHPRDVFRAAILLGAASFIVAHNHPSNDTTPSEEDLQVTRRLEEAGKLMGIPLVDQIILGRNDFVSYQRVAA
jgi:DNA repair protein RadC